MTRSLAGQFLHAHADAPVAAGREAALRVDHVLVREDDGPLAFAGFEALGATRVGCECAIAVLEQPPAGPEAAADARRLQGAALAYGAHFVRAGSGPAAAVYRRRFAAPGRLLLTRAPGADTAGGAGTLVLPAEAAELSVALAGIRHEVDVPPVVGVRPKGEPTAGLGADDVLDAVHRALDASAHGAIVEFGGPGVGWMPVALRLEVARLAPLRLGALTCLFSSDERLRAWLRARGRESEWRRLEGGTADLEECRTIALDTLGPAPAARAGAPVARVHVGPLAEDDALRALARGLRGARVADGVALEIAPGGRAARRALDEAGAHALADAGARLLDDAGAPAPAAPTGATLALGELVADADAYHASAAACALAAARGRVPSADDLARAADGEAARDEALPAALEDGDVLEPLLPGEEPTLEREPDDGPLELLEPLGGPLRGGVLLVLGDDVDGARILPWGPRAQAVRARPHALAELAFRAFDADLASRARAAGGGFLVAGRNYGAGAAAEPVARATAALGVRAILAVSFAAAQRRALALAGVLALSWARPDDARTVAPGDELELPGLPEVLAPQRPIEVRNLTRGLSYGAHHHLGARALAIARAGGLLRFHARST